eukprot:jgi/Ulvmu1/1916/UM012_0076.1
MADVDNAPIEEQVADLPVQDLTLGEKKKKKKKVDRSEELAAMEAEAAPEQLDLALKKKKKKKKVRSADELEDVDTTEKAPADGETVGGKFPWSGTDREYKYEELLERVYGILSEKNPELSSVKKRILLRPPEVQREGTKKTVFANFMDLCKMMNRNSEHVQQFLLAELA